jgi:hypothetical protein
VETHSQQKTNKMKTNLLHTLTASLLFALPAYSFAQAPTLGTAADFVLFSTNGAVSNNAISQLTGNVGTNNGSSTFFGNVNGGMHDQDPTSAQCATDLLTAYNLLKNTTKTGTLAPALGSGQSLFAGVYLVPSASTLDGILTLDAQNNASAVFIFQIEATLSVGVNAKVKLKNGALACNVFWKVEGLVDMSAGVNMKGTVIANNAAINMNTGDTLEGRALSTAGAVSVDGVLAYTPTGCNSPVHNGPAAPALASTSCYAVFSTDGAVSNSGITTITGDVGTNNGSTTGFDPLKVNGKIHPIPDPSTAACASDLLKVYNYLLGLPADIELLYPAQFGRSLVLTPHTYIMKAAAALTDTLYLNAEGNPNAVFVIGINGALTTSTYCNVKLINGTQSQNVFWRVEGAVDIGDYSKFRGTIVVNNGALGALHTGVLLDGRALTTTGALTCTAMSVISPSPCLVTGIESAGVKNTGDAVSVFPNPFHASVNIVMNDASQINNAELKLFNVLGEEVMNTKITNQLTILETSNFAAGIYFYKVMSNSKIIQSGRLIAR